MKQFKEYLIKEAAGDKVGEPHKPLKGHVDEKSAFVVDDYPYGFNQRTKIRYWLEYKKGKGWRFVAQTLDPKRQRWNNPKASTYVEFSAFMYQDSKGYVGWKGLSQYSSLEEAQKWLKDYRDYLDPTAISILEYVIKRKTQMGLKESSFDFKVLDGPRTKKSVGGVVGAKGISPEDAIKHYLIGHGYGNISIEKKDGLIKATAKYNNFSGSKETFYYQLKESTSEVSQIISHILNRKYPQKISLKHQDNFLTVTFEVRKAGGRGALYQKGQLEAQEKTLRDKAVKLAKSLMNELMKKVRIEDTDLSFDPVDPDVTLFLVSDDFVGLQKPYLTLGESTTLSGSLDLIEAYYSNSDFYRTKEELVRSGITLDAANKIIDIVLGKSYNKYNYDGDPYPDMSVVVYPKNALNGDIGFIVYSLDKDQSRFGIIHKEILKILKKENIQNIIPKQVQTGYSFTWKKK